MSFNPYQSQAPTNYTNYAMLSQQPQQIQVSAGYADPWNAAYMQKSPMEPPHQMPPPTMQPQQQQQPMFMGPPMPQNAAPPPYIAVPTHHLNQMMQKQEWAISQIERFTSEKRPHFESLPSFPGMVAPTAPGDEPNPKRQKRGKSARKPAMVVRKPEEIPNFGEQAIAAIFAKYPDDFTERKPIDYSEEAVEQGMALLNLEAATLQLDMARCASDPAWKSLCSRADVRPREVPALEV